MSNFSRREFVTGAIAGVACSLTIGGSVWGQTSTSSTKPSTQPSTGFDAGNITSLKEGFNNPTGAVTKKVVVVKSGGKVYALPSVCTHQGGTLRITGGILKCSKHGATFDMEGNPTSGPAKRQLARYGVEVSNGHLIVDTNRFFFEGEHEKEGAFVKA